MKQVLIIAPDFPPSTYPPALRARYFAQYLPEFGWQPTVFTIDARDYEWPIDNQNGSLVPKNIEVVRTRALPVRFTRRIGIGDIGLRSLWAHWQTIRKLCKDKKFDLVFVSIPPYIPSILARMSFEHFKIPYVIDYIDPWVIPNYWKTFFKRPLKRTLAHLLSLFLEPLVLARASCLTGVSRGLTELVLSRYSKLSQMPTCEIPFGGEPGDFDFLKKNPIKNKIFSPGNGFFHMSYVGMLNADFLPQLEAVMRAVKIGCEKFPGIFSPLRLHFIGTSYAAHTNVPSQALPLAKKIGIEDKVDEHTARISYLEAVQVLLDSDALLAVGSNKIYYAASKIFPYILARKPILAFFHEKSSVVKILKETRAGEIVTFNLEGDLEEKTLEILKSLEKILNSNCAPAVQWDQFEQYTTKAMTKRLAEVFRSIQK
jgi:hypothetical protein